MLIHSGLRIGDSLKFDPQALKLTTVNTKVVYSALVQRQGKTEMPVRIYIPCESGDIIKQAPRLSDEYAFIPKGKENGKRFRSWLNNSPKVLFPPLERASGVRHVHAHRFRDTFAADVWAKTKDIRYVSRRLGHSSVKVTIDHYWYFLEKDEDKAAEQFFSVEQS